MERKKRNAARQMILQSRRGKLAELGKLIIVGSYRIRAEEIAGKMLNKFLFKPALGRYLNGSKPERVSGVAERFEMGPLAWN